MAILSGWAKVPPPKSPAPSNSGFSLVPGMPPSKGSTPAPGYGNFLPVVHAAPVPKTLPAGIQPWGSVNLGDVSAFGSWGGDYGNEWTPAAAPDAGGGGYGGGGGGYPSFNYDINADPNVISARGQEQLGLSQLDANLAEARRQAIIRFGDASLADTAGFGLDPQAADFAKQNYLSGNADLARLNKAHDLRRQAIINKLAGQGILFSGDTGYLQGQEDQVAGNNLYDAKNKVLDYLRGLSDTYLDRKNQLRQATLQALQSASAAAMSNPAYYGGGGGGSGGGGSGGIGFDPGAQAALAGQGYSSDAVSAAARAYAAAHGGWGINAVKQEGTVTYQNGRPGVYVKYNTPQGSSTEWTPIG